MFACEIVSLAFPAKGNRKIQIIIIMKAICQENNVYLITEQIN